jgi:PAS domain S-box-containing protein/putative nucleotidyltransferase with HDIG domain
MNNKNMTDYGPSEVLENRTNLQLTYTTEILQNLNRVKDKDRICSFFCGKIKEIIGRGYVFVTLMEADGKSLALKSIEGFEDKELIDSAINILGLDPRNMRFSTDDMSASELAAFRSGRLELVPGGIYDLLARKFPKVICNTLENLLKIHFVYSIGFVYQNLHLGGVIILLDSQITTEEKISNIENMVNRSAIYLSRIYTEEMKYLEEQRFTSALENSNLGVWERDLINNTTYYSKSFKKMLGFYNDGMSTSFDEFYSRVHPDDKEKLFNTINDNVAGITKRFNAEFRIQCKNTKYKWVLGRGSVISRGKDGNALKSVGVLLDITDKIKAEKEIKKALFYNRALIEASIDPLVTINKFGKITDVNKATEKVTGLLRRNLIGSDFSESFTEPDKARDGYKKVLLKGNIRNYPLTIKHQSGKTTSVLYNATVYRNESGKVQGVFAAAHDITDKIKAEKEIKNLSKYPSENPNQVIRTDDKGKILYFNRACDDMPGWNKKIGDIVPQRILKYVQGSAKLQLDKNFTVQFKPKTFSFSLVYNKEQNYIGLYGEDISDKILAQQELFETERIYQSLFENSVDGIYQATVSGRYITANPSLIRMLGYESKEEILKLNIPKQVYLAAEDRPKANERGKPFIRQLRKKDGSTIWVEINSKVFYSCGKPKYYQGIIRDITAKVVADQHLKQSYNKIKKTLDDSIKTISNMVEARDPYTSGHQIKVANLCSVIAKELGFNKDRIKMIHTAALIHDVGKIAVPASILAKPSHLSNIEFAMVKTHSQIGYDILKEIDFGYPIAEIVYQHHERDNGSGYPKGLSGKDIMLEAKIIAVADTVESMATHRPYRPALGIEEALKELELNSGILYDSKIVNVCIKIFKDNKFKFEETVNNLV